MFSLIYTATFLFCVAAGAAGILITRQLMLTYESEFPRHHFYYLVAFYAFAFYGIWGQILARALLSSTGVDGAVVETVAGYLSVLSVPFLFVSWLMLVNMAYSMFGRATQQAWMLAHAAVFIVLILGAWVVFGYFGVAPQFLEENLGLIEITVLAALELSYFSVFLVVALRHAVDVEGPRRRVLVRLSLLLFAAFLLRSSFGAMGMIEARLLPLALVVFFGSNLLPVLFSRTVSDEAFEPVKAESASDEGMEAIFVRYGITKRERQIVQEICRGRTNQQIADALFISLQTVKDHTHRIYSKMGIRSRMQLVTRMGGST